MFGQYFKKYFDAPGTFRPGYNEVRLIYYGYPQITDNPALRLADSTATSVFVETIPTPQTYRGTNSPTITTSTTSSDTASTTSKTSTVGIPGMGNNSTMTTTSGVGPDYSQTVTEGYNTSSISMTGTTPSAIYLTETTAITQNLTTPTASSAITSTAPEVTNTDFYITFNVPDTSKRLAKRALKYLAFDENNESTLVDSESEATAFHLNAAGNLVTSGDTPQYVAIDTDVNPPQFSLQDTVPDAPVTVNVDGNGSVSFAGVESYCLTQDGDLAVITNGNDAPPDCKSVTPELVNTADNSATTTDTRTSSTLSNGNNGGTTTLSTTSISTAITTGTSSISPTSTARPVNGFIYSGCFGIPETFAPISGISSPYTSDAMTNELCTSHCNSPGVPSLFAATHNTTCFCASTLDLYMLLLEYPDQTCNIPCPGANREMCGGDVGFQNEGPTSSFTPVRLGRRQGALLLISLYNNTNIGSGPGQSNTPTTSTDTAPITPTLPISGDGVPTSFPADQVSYNVTGTNTATVISTTYIDICDVCPGGLTTSATTITVPHRGCTASCDNVLQTVMPVPSPSVPMTTTVKSCACGEQGAPSSITVTVPHTSSIAQLAAQVISNMSPPAQVAAPSPVAAAAVANLAEESNQRPQYAANTAAGPATTVSSAAAHPSNTPIQQLKSPTNAPIMPNNAHGNLIAPLATTQIGIMSNQPYATTPQPTSNNHINTTVSFPLSNPASNTSINRDYHNASLPIGISPFHSRGSKLIKLRPLTSTVADIFRVEIRSIFSIYLVAFLAGIALAW